MERGMYMDMSDLIPWNKEKSEVQIRHEREEDALLDIRKQMNRMFDDFFERPFGLSRFPGMLGALGDFSPYMDVSETDKEITISAELPGIEPEDIHITLDQNTLSIRGEKKFEKEEKRQHFYQVERSFGSFHRLIDLPSEVDEKEIDATFKNGVLKVKLPKTKKAQEEIKRITIRSG
jgi:HSP20 family protein